MDSTQILGKVREIIDAGNTRVSVARDPVNRPMIHHLCDALEDTNPIYADPEAALDAGHRDVVAPPASLQVWNMVNPSETRAESDVERAYEVLQGGGFRNVVAVNCEQEYDRYLSPGDLLTCAEAVEDIAGPKRTGLGEGFFITTLTSFYDQHGESVGRMRFRTLWYATDEQGDNRG